MCIAKNIDNKIADYKEKLHSVDKELNEFPKNEEYSSYYNKRASIQKEIEYLENYKKNNPILWTPTKEETTAETKPDPLSFEITKRQVKLWLLQNGYNPKTYPIELIAKIPDETLKMQAEIEWEDGDTYSRNSDFVKALITDMGWDSKVVDKFWQQITVY